MACSPRPSCSSVAIRVLPDGLPVRTGYSKFSKNWIAVPVQPKLTGAQYNPNPWRVLISNQGREESTKPCGRLRGQ
jgi:hypothetical protein